MLAPVERRASARTCGDSLETGLAVGGNIDKSEPSSLAPL